MSPLNNERFGLAADRPLVATLRDKGTIWYSTDTDEVWTSDGVDWTLLGGPGSGAPTIFDLFANQPAANTVVTGTIFVATDTGDTYISDATTWYTVTGGASGALSFTPQRTIAVSGAVLTTDRLLLLDAPSLTATLYAGSVDTELVTIKDYTDDAFNFPHTINVTAPDTIEHVGSLLLDFNGGAVTLSYNPVDQNWMVV